MHKHMLAIRRKEDLKEIHIRLIFWQIIDDLPKICEILNKPPAKRAIEGHLIRPSATLI